MNRVPGGGIINDRGQISVSDILARHDMFKEEASAVVRQSDPAKDMNYTTHNSQQLLPAVFF